MNRLLLFFLLISSSFSLSAQKLTARFSKDTGFVCSSFTVKFKDLSTGPDPIVSWKWNFGDGSTSVEQSPSHYFWQYGPNLVSLMVKDSKGDSAIVRDTVYVLLVMGLEYYKYYLCNDSPVTIKSKAANYPAVNAYQSYAWSNGATTPAITVSTPGIYHFSVIGCGTSTGYGDSVEVVAATRSTAITPVPVPDTMRARLGYLTRGMKASMIYEDADYGLTHWNWGDGKTSSNNAVGEKVFHVYAQPGIYTVTCSVTLNDYTAQAPCGDTTISYQLTVSDEFSAKIGILNQSCSTVTFEDSSYTEGFNTYPLWLFGDGSIKVAYVSKPTHVYPKDSTYTVRLIVKDTIAGKSDTTYKIVKIQTKPLVNLIPDTTIAAGADITLGNTYPALSGYTYLWSTGDTTSVLSVKTPGLYTLSITNCGNTVSDSVYIRIIASDTPRVNFTYESAACNPRHITFTDITPALASPQDSIITYSWNFGNQTTASTKNASADYQDGTYNVVLKVTTLSGLTATISKPLVIADSWKVHAEIISINKSCIDTATIHATAEGTDAPYTITWNKPLVNDLWVISSGVYIAFLKDSCGNIRATDSVNIVLSDPLTVSIHQNNDTLYGSLSKDINNATWKWYRNDTLLSGDTLAYIIPAKSGTYKTVVTGSPGCTAIAAPIVYTAAPEPPIPTTVNFTYEVSPCNKQILTFTGIVNGTDSIVKFEWFFDNELRKNTKNFTDEFIAGIYSVRFRVTDIDGDTTSTFQQIVILANTPWSARIADETLVCADTATLAAYVFPYSGGYLWSNGDTAQTIRVTTSGRYYLMVKDSCNAIRATDSIDIVVNPVAKATIRQAGDTLIASAGIYYYWYKDNIELDMGHQQFLFPTVSGTYTVDIASESGCIRTSAPFIYTIPVDTVIVSIDNDGLFLNASFAHDFNTDNVFTAELMLDNDGGRTTGLQPNEIIALGSINSSNKNVNIQVAIPDSLACADNYIIRIKASSPVDTTIWSKQFSIINQPPKPVITQLGDSLFTSGIYNWQWYKNNVAIDGAISANYRARANANYTVEAKNGTGCNSMSSAVAVVITAVGEVTLGTNTAKVFPNPSEGQVYLQFSKPLLKAVTIKVHDVQGQIRYSRTTQQQLQQLDLTHLPKGIYMIELSGYGTQKVLTIVLQ